MILTEERKLRIQELFNNIPEEQWKDIEKRLEELSDDKLSKDIIDKYNFKYKISKPDWDDVEITYTLPNGLELSALTVCSNQPCDVDTLYGIDEYLIVNTVTELEKLMSLTFDEILDDVAKQNPDFNIEDY